MGIYKLGKIFEPYSIAIIGASERRERIGSMLAVARVIMGTDRHKAENRTCSGIRAFE